MAKTIAILGARLIFGGAFFIAAFFKFTGMGATAGYIASIGFPIPLFFAWAAAFFELGLVLAFVTGALFTEAAALAAAYVLFLALAFHGPSHWESNPMEFGFFVDHFTFIAGLLFAAVHGPSWKPKQDLDTHGLSSKHKMSSGLNISVCPSVNRRPKAASHFLRLFKHPSRRIIDHRYMSDHLKRDLGFIDGHLPRGSIR